MATNKKQVAFISFILTASLLSANNPPRAETVMPIDNPTQSAPDFTLASLDGDQVTLSRLRNKNGIVLVFFATWCIKCVKEVPEIKEFSVYAQKENIMVVGINYKESEDKVKQFRQSRNIPYEILLDKDGTMTTSTFGIRGLPHIIGINAKGEIVFEGADLPDDKDDFILKLKQGL
jgi:peroxiredoxin